MNTEQYNSMKSLSNLGGPPLARPLTYLASPYSHPEEVVRERRFRLVTDAAAWLIENKGWNVFSPITHSHPLADLGGLKGDWEVWKQIDTEYLGVSQRMVVLQLDGWNSSTGVLAEIKIAHDMLVPVYYMSPDLERGGYSITLKEGGDETLEDQRWGSPSMVFNTPPGPLLTSDLAASTMRKFQTGATRDTEEGKFDYEGFLSPEVLEMFGAYMHKHRKQSDGGLRDSDNWQKGIPMSAYVKSLWRHFMQFWKLHRGLETRDEKGNLVTIPEVGAAIMFNVMGYMFEHMKASKKQGYEQRKQGQ